VINVNTFRDSVLAIANKDNAGFKPNANEFNAMLDDALRATYNWLFGSASVYQQGRPVAPVSTEKTRFVAEAERYLQERRIVVAQNNRVPVPDGSTFDQDGQIMPAFRHLIKMYSFYIPAGTTTAQRYEIDVVPTRDIARKLDSEINAPTQKYPIAELSGNYWQVYPQTTHVEIVYQRRPLTPKWGYTINLNVEARFRREIYDPATSVDIDLPDELANHMRDKVLHLMGIRERDPFIVQVVPKGLDV